MAHTDKDMRCICETAYPGSCPHCFSWGSNAAHRKACHQRQPLKERRGQGRRWHHKKWRGHKVWVRNVFTHPERRRVKVQLLKGEETDPFRHKMRAYFD